MTKFEGGGGPRPGDSQDENSGTHFNFFLAHFIAFLCLPQWSQLDSMEPIQCERMLESLVFLYLL